MEGGTKTAELLLFRFNKAGKEDSLLARLNRLILGYGKSGREVMQSLENPRRIQPSQGSSPAAPGAALEHFLI